MRRINDMIRQRSASVCKQQHLIVMAKITGSFESGRRGIVSNTMQLNQNQNEDVNVTVTGSRMLSTFVNNDNYPIKRMNMNMNIDKNKSVRTVASNTSSVNVHSDSLCRTNSIPFLGSNDDNEDDEEEVNDDMRGHKSKGRHNLNANIVSTFVTEKELRTLASKKSTPLSLAQMYRYASSDMHTGQRLRNAQFLHRELQIRISQRIVELRRLPCGLGKMGDIQNVINTYLVYLQKLSEFPCPQSNNEEKEFTILLQSFVLDRKSIPQALSRGINSLRDHRREGLTSRKIKEMEVALYRFFTARVGLRFLTEHHVLSAPYDHDTDDEPKLSLESSEYERPSFKGCIQKDCRPVDEVEKVVRLVTRNVERSFGKAPPIEIIDCTKNSKHGDVFTYVPTHLHYILAELLKNSCRATMKR